ncbi:condensation domain-containing protein [Bacillus thuringiensis]|uniref:condensation domain-containing protein n=1 Tax=Bacillus thuringiensis TaxID=1428 RepID=UPI000BF84C94|nr:condensation domain-containing protein [Bacillus thuringiensis]MED3685579.1 condensation domain-containing protein [Bacillus thuringiensis]PFS25374.1 bacitracin synthetase [Bacillus thuringiensis]
MGNYASSILYDVEPCKSSEQNCIDDVIATLANWFKRKHYLMYARLWDFGFSPVDKGNLGDGLYTESGYFVSDLEKYHGIKSTIFDTDSSDEGFEIILEQLYSGFPVVVTMNAYWLPWDENYLKNHIVHSFVIVGYEPEEDCLIITDPYFMVKNAQLSTELFHKGYQKVSTLKVTEDEITDIQSITTDLSNWIKHIKDEKHIFSQMHLFATQLISKFDLNKETDGYLDFNDVPLFSHLGQVVDGRVKFSKMLSFLGEHYHSDFQTIAESMKTAAANWGVIRGSLIKMHLTKSVTKEGIVNISDKIHHAAEYEQNLAEQIMTFLISVIEGNTKNVIIDSSPSIEQTTNYVKPIDDMERKLVDIWKEVIGNPCIGVEDNFFALGGHSLHATVINAKIWKEFNVQLSLANLFEYPTIRTLSHFIKNSKENRLQEIEIVPESEVYPVSSTQKRMMLLQEMDGVQMTYNVPSCFILKGTVDRKRIELVFEKLIKRHEILRTQFEWQGDQLVQRVLEQVTFELEMIKGDYKEWLQPFNLSKVLLMRAGLKELKDNSYLLVIDLHHIITDGVSLSIFMHDFKALYAGETLPENRLQYKDYAVWEQKLLSSKEFDIHKKYWEELFSGDIPVLELPYDRGRPPVKSFEGEQYNFQVNKEITQKIKKIAIETDTTPFMLLMATFTIFLYKHGEQKDVIIGSPVAGRPHADLLPLMGLFVNTIALRYQINPNQSFINHLKKVKNDTLEAFEHQVYPFDQLVEKLDFSRDLSRSALFDVMFVLQNSDEKHTVVDGLEISTETNTDTLTSKFDLTLIAEENKDIYEFTFEYATSLFDKSTIVEFGRRFNLLLEEITTHPNVSLKDIQMLTSEEKELVLSATQEKEKIKIETDFNWDIG